MPNGESKNWVRFIITLESFYSLFGRWPLKIHLYLFEMNSSVIPADPEERGKLMTTLVNLVKSDIDSGALIMSGTSPDGRSGFLVSKQDIKEIYGRSAMVGPYAKFEVLPMLTIDEVMDAMKGMQK